MPQAAQDKYVAEGLLGVSLLESFQLAKKLRENADYYGEFSEAAASQLIEDAKEFCKIARKSLK